MTKEFIVRSGIILLFAFSFACHFESDRKGPLDNSSEVMTTSKAFDEPSENEKVTSDFYGRYGAGIDTLEVMDMATLAELMKEEDSLMVKVSGEILSTCSKKGCWMDLSTGTDLPMKVRFKDYGFFVPTSGVEGKQAVVEGVVKKQELSVEILRHYAEDAGQSEEFIAGINTPKETMTFTASGVIIR